MLSSAKGKDLVTRRERARRQAGRKGACQRCRWERPSTCYRARRTSPQRLHRLPSNRSSFWGRDFQAVPAGGTSGSGLRPPAPLLQVSLRVRSFLARRAGLAELLVVSSLSISGVLRLALGCSLVRVVSATLSQALVLLPFQGASSSPSLPTVPRRSRLPQR